MVTAMLLMLTKQELQTIPDLDQLGNQNDFKVTQNGENNDSDVLQEGNNNKEEDLV
jgi:hypothetical protein